MWEIFGCKLIGLFTGCGGMVWKEGSQMTSSFFWLQASGCTVLPFTKMGKPVVHVCAGVWFVAELNNSVLDMSKLKCLLE